MPRFTLALLLALLALPALASPAALPPEPASPEPAPTLVSPPILLGAVQAPLPEGALPPGADPVEVLITLVIDEDGVVRDAELASSSGIDALDSAALNAMLQSRFHPAQDSAGASVLVTIDFPVRFVAPPLQPPPPPSATLSGRVLMMGSRAALPGVTLIATPAVRSDRSAAPEVPTLGRPDTLAAVADPERLPPRPELLPGQLGEADPALWDPLAGPTFATETTDDGAFAFPALPAGGYLISLSGGENQPITFVESLAPAQSRVLVYRTLPAELAETSVRVTRSRGEVVRSLDSEEIKKAPGTFGDPLGAVKALPGVTYTPTMSRGAGENRVTQLPVVRGTAATDSIAWLDGLPTPLITHSSADQTIVGDFLVERAFLIPGAAPAAYGDHIGGVIGLDLRSPRSDRFGGFIQPGISETSLALEGPISRRARFYVGFERDYLGWLFAAIYPPGSAFLFRVPPYHQNQQAVLEFDPIDRLRLRVSYLGSRDGLRLTFGEDVQGNRDPYYHRSSHFDRISASADLRGPATLRSHSKLAMTFWGREWEFSPVPVGASESHVLIHALQRLDGAPVPWLQLSAGALTELDILIWDATETTGDRENTGPQTDLRASGLYSGSHRDNRLWMSGWMGAAISPIEALTLSPELRVDWWEELGAIEPQPRLRLVARPNRHLQIALAAGRFAQRPELTDSNPITGNPDLGPETAWHIDAGVALDPIEGIHLELQGYVRWMEELVISVAEPTDFSDLSQPEHEEDPTHGLANGGLGRGFGGELLLRFASPGTGWGLSGWASYGLGWSQRRDAVGEEWTAYSQDRRHLATVMLQLRIPGEASFGARFRVQSGAPGTPIVDSVFFADQGRFLPVYADPYSVRGKPFHRLDLRFDKTFREKGAVIGFYVDVSNVYYAREESLIGYSFDYSESGPITQIPDINSGVRVEF